MASSSEMKNTLENFLIPLEEINLATNHFDKKNLIGDGGFGKVYKGKLSQRWGNREAAIKRRDPKSYQGKHEFDTEVKMVSTFHHPNIISFIGYCDEGKEMIIVYEYAINRSLDKHLIDVNRRGSLTWARRLNISLGAARALEYLHSGLGDVHRVIHRDVKSANILLDDNMEAKICDFGLSRSGPRNQANTQVHTRVAGTSSYVDPIYREGGILRKESDVYSFGVVLFEMLSGMLVFQERSIGGEEPRTLINLVRQKWDVGPDMIIDHYIRDEIHGDSLETFKGVAYKCISFDLKERPTMDSIVKEIEKALRYQENSPWKKLLPGKYQEIIRRIDPHVAYKNKGELDSLLFAGILIDGGKKWFSLNEMNKKNCLIISAMELFDKGDPNIIDGGKWLSVNGMNKTRNFLMMSEELFEENENQLIGWESFPGTRFTHVAKFRHGKTTMHVTATMLSLESTYAVFLICKYTGKEHKARTKSSPPDIRFGLLYGERNINPTSAEWKDEEWMEVELFMFTNHMEVANFELHLEWRDDGDYGLYVEGIEFRPIEMATIENDETKVEQLSELESDTDWERKLPSDYEEVIRRSTEVLEFSTKEELYWLLSRGILIDDNSMWFWLDASNGKKCVLLYATCLTVNHIDGKLEERDSYGELEEIEQDEYAQSRKECGLSSARCLMIRQVDRELSKISRESQSSEFPTSLTVQDFLSAEIRGKIKAHMLSPKTPYAAWLVHDSFCSKNLCIASLTLGNQEKKTRRVYLNDSSPTIRPMNEPKYSFKYMRTGSEKLDRRCRKRNDGWHEVELFPFFNDMDAHDEVEVGVHINSKSSDNAILIEGIEFRPQ